MVEYLKLSIPERRFRFTFLTQIPETSTLFHQVRQSNLEITVQQTLVSVSLGKENLYLEFHIDGQTFIITFGCFKYSKGGS